MVSGLVSNIQKFSLHDGPGIRTTVFLKGCPLQCAWCHNPENISRRPEMVVLEARCVRCGECAKVCPQTDGSKASPPQEQNWEPQPLPDCMLCETCVDGCPTGARTMVGRLQTAEEVCLMLSKDRVFYEESQGGVTISGGEPLVQFEFLKALLNLCRAQGFHTAVDTCGFAPTDHLLEIAPLVNLFLYDLKFIDERSHEQFTGVSNALILDNLRKLAGAHDHIWLRIPVIPGVNDAPDELEAMAQFATALPSVRQVNLLPYHKAGLQKFKRLGRTSSLEDVAVASGAYMAGLGDVFRKLGLTVKVGG